MDTWQQVLSIRKRGARVRGLLFLRSFLLGASTALVHVAAITLLLRYQPARTLPLGYLLGALAMLLTGWTYVWLMQRWAAPSQARRGVALIAGSSSLLAAGALLAGDSLPAAIGLVVGYYLLQLLTSLVLEQADNGHVPEEHTSSLPGFTGFGSLCGGTLGTGLAVFGTAWAGMTLPLLLASGACLGALYSQHLIGGAGAGAAHPAPAHSSAPAAPAGKRGQNSLVAYLGASLLALTVAATGAEYTLFVEAQQLLPNQTSVLWCVGGVLALTYLLAALGRPLLRRSGPAGRPGLPHMLSGLLLLALSGAAVLGGLRLLGDEAGSQLAVFGGLYLGLEVLRRAASEPAVLQLLRPLPPNQRLRAHVLMKGMFEPLGLGLAGLLLLGRQQAPIPDRGVLLAGLGCLLLSLLLLRRASFLSGPKPAPGSPLPGQPTPPSHPEPPDYPDPETGGYSRRLSDDPALLAAECNLSHPAVATRQQAISILFTQAYPHSGAEASLQQLAASPDAEQRRAALALLQFLPPSQQVALLRTCLHSLEPALTKAAVTAAAQTTTPAVPTLLLSLLEEKAVRKVAAEALVGLGDAALPALEAALQQHTAPALLRRLATVCASLATPASRRVLVALAQQPHLNRRAAALQALARFDSVTAEAPLFQHLLQRELRLAQQLLHGMLGANVELRSCLKYELTKVQQRLFGLLLQLYNRQPILNAQRGVARVGPERQAKVLETLDGLLPRPLYQGLQALVETGRLTKKVQTFDQLLGPVPPEPILATILHRGEEVFAPWTLSVALRQWQPTPATVGLLHAYLHATQPLVRESAEDVLALLPARYPAVYEHWCSLYPTPGAPPSLAPRIAAVDRLLLLKHTALFAATPENVLSSLVPIMNEVHFPQQQTIFVKGELGTSLFIIYTGEVGIFTDTHQLATFREGDFFGELALLDAEPRSATAVAHGPVVAFRLDQEDIYDVMEECPEVLQNILRVLCQRLRQQNEKLKALAQTETVR